jgi:hypothetical protein
VARRNSLKEKARLRQERARRNLDPAQPVDLLGTVELLHRHLDASLCETVFQSQRKTERRREWTLQALAEFWTAVILRAPQALTQVLQEAARGVGGLPQVQTTEEAFFKRCKNLHWRFFAALWERFTERLLGDAPVSFAAEAACLLKRFANVWIVDGSRLDAIAHRLKILHDVRAAILPGCLLVAYDLFRGIPRRFCFDPDGTASEMVRTYRLLDQIPRDTLLVGDRLYASMVLFHELTLRQLGGLFRLNGLIKFRRLQRLSRVRVPGGILEDWRVEAGCGATAPQQMLRYLRLKQGNVVHELLTNVLDPRQLPAAEAMNLYPYRWTIERMFFDLKEVLNLHRFYAANPNAVAMQVYAAAMVYTAMRVAQARIARQLKIEPEQISPQKLFPRLATASCWFGGVTAGFLLMRQANRRTRLKTPSVRGRPEVTTTAGAILVEKRSEHRRRRRFCEGRRKCKSFKHVSGGRRLLN